jgi:hypothetical protein
MNGVDILQGGQVSDLQFLNVAGGAIERSQGRRLWQAQGWPQRRERGWLLPAGFLAFS